MPHGSVSSTYLDILESAALGHFATIDRAGRPQVNPVWFTWSGEYILIGVLDNTRKLGNVRRDPHIALSMADLTNPGRYLEIRGEVIDIALQSDDEFVNLLARKYTGADYPSVESDPPLYKLTIQINSWTAQA